MTYEDTRQNALAALQI